VDSVTEEEYVLKLHKNVYGTVFAGKVWYDHLVTRLERAGFTKSEHDDCLFYCGQALYVLYTDDSILMGPDSKELDEIVERMRQQELELTEEGDIADFLGVELKRTKNGEIECTQPQLITSILKDLRLAGTGAVTKDTPAKVGEVLTIATKERKFDKNFNYRSVVGKLNHVEKCTRPDIAFATHQCARFQIDPREQHGKAVKWLGRYLAGTRDKGIILKPKEQSFETYVDADFAGAYDHEYVLEDDNTTKSRTGYIILYAGVPLCWASKLQTLTALSTTEAELIALSTALRQTLWLMKIVREMKEYGFNIQVMRPTVKCKAFEDNSGALAIARMPRARPRTKHLAIRYHHFKNHVGKDVDIEKISTDDQHGDMETKSLPRERRWNTIAGSSKDGDPMVASPRGSVGI
jgi:hypothetical protein